MTKLLLTYMWNLLTVTNICYFPLVYTSDTKLPLVYSKAVFIRRLCFNESDSEQNKEKENGSSFVMRKHRFWNEETQT